MQGLVNLGTGYPRLRRWAGLGRAVGPFGMEAAKGKKVAGGLGCVGWCWWVPLRVACVELLGIVDRSGFSIWAVYPGVLAHGHKPPKARLDPGLPYSHAFSVCNEGRDMGDVESRVAYAMSTMNWIGAQGRSGNAAQVFPDGR
jgi:hypothetical protein